MSFQAIRSTFEVALNDAYAGLSPAVPVVFDNVDETPPPLPHVLVNLTYTDMTNPVICPTEAAMEQIGQHSGQLLHRRGQGMKQLEELAAVAMQRWCKCAISVTLLIRWLARSTGRTTCWKGTHRMRLRLLARLLRQRASKLGIPEPPQVRPQ